MRHDGGGIDERFTAYVRDRGDHHLRVAVLLTGDWHAAEDLVQASLVKLYRAWRRETPAEALPDGLSGDDIADRQALGALVRQALAGLPRQQRAVLVLRYCEDLPEADVAGLLGCSVGTVKTHTHRGLRALRDVLGGEFDSHAVNETRASQRDSG